MRTPSASAEELMRQGASALGRGDWDAARAAFERASAITGSPDAFAGLADACWWLRDEAGVFEARERAFQLYRECGDRASAGGMAAWLANDSIDFRGQPAVANGWLQRGYRVLEGLEDTTQYALLATIDAHLALMLRNDATETRVLTARAIEAAQAAGSIDFEMLARAIEGLAMVTAGEIASGMSRLDEAATAAIAGEAGDLLARGWILCLVMDACDRVRDYDRAAQWCARARDFAASESDAGAMFYSFCRPHYAVVLMWRGEWEEAEVELVAAIDQLDLIAPPMAVEAVVRLAELRFRQGRWEDAALLFDRVESEPLAQLGRAELALSRSDAASAVELAERYLRRLPSNDRIERAAGLDVLVRALAADGRAAATTEPLGELVRIADGVGTDAVRASACHGRGLVAAALADHEEARRMFEDAVDAYRRAGAPFELGRARASLARSLRDDGRGEAAVAEARAAYDVLFALGALREARGVADILRGMGVETPEPASPAPPGPLTARETEVLGLIAQGRSNQQIADTLVLSIRTVERHISNIYGKIGAEGPGARAAATAYALRPDPGAG